jgi:hypothetical protein
MDQLILYVSVELDHYITHKTLNELRITNTCSRQIESLLWNSSHTNIPVDTLVRHQELLARNLQSSLTIFLTLKNQLVLSRR